LDIEYKEKKEDEDDILEAYVSFQGDGSVLIGLIDPDVEWSVERKTLNEAKAAFQQIVQCEFEDKTINYVYDGVFEDGDNQELYGKALELCTEKHAGQVDKAGKPYLGHIARVAGEFYDEKAIVALLHDIVEDTDVTPGELLQKGFSKEIVDAVVAITKKENESYESFIERVGKNKMAREVKIADLEDNMNIRRLPRISEEDMVRLNNYLVAWRYLISFKKEE
jgi:hypothetical protein